MDDYKPPGWLTEGLLQLREEIDALHDLHEERDSRKSVETYLRTEVEQLRETVSVLKRQAGEYLGQAGACQAEADTLRAGNARLREALEWYAADGDERFQIVDSKGEAVASFASFTSRARAALFPNASKEEPR